MDENSAAQSGFDVSEGTVAPSTEQDNAFLAGFMGSEAGAENDDAPAGDAAAGDDAPAGQEDAPAGDEEPPAGEAEQDAAAKPGAAQSGKLLLKYNGQEMEVSAEEAVVLAQKGLAAEKLVERAEGSRENRMLRRLANISGMDTAAYLDQLERGMYDMMVQERVAQGFTPEAAEEYVAMQLQDNERAEADRAAAAEAEQVAAFQALVDKYPEVDTLSPEVSRLIAEGLPPLYAYETVMNQQALAKTEQELAALKADRKNRSSAPGSAAGLGEAAPQDPFLAGWNSVGDY